MPAIPQISDFHQGDTRRYKFHFRKNVGTADEPVYENVTIVGWKIFLTFKGDKSDPDANAEAQVSATAGNYADDDPVNGVMYVILPSDVSEELPIGKLYYDFQRVIAGTPPDVRTLADSEVEILQGVTNTTVTL